MNWKSISLHILFIATTGWLISSSFSIERQEIEIVNGVETIQTIRNPQLIIKLICFIGISITAAYVNIWNLFRLSSGANNQFIISRSIVVYMASLTILVFTNRTDMFFPSPRLPFSLVGGISLFYFTISIAYALTRTWIQSEKQRQQLEIEKRRAEINLLRNQLQPHFLFNALNNLLSMVDQKSSPRLASSFEQLSRLLRYVIDETRDDRVTIGKEIAFIENYVALQLLRFETDEVNFKFEQKGEYDQQSVEPGLFISFVENAFKYGTEPEKQVTIEMMMDLTEQDRIVFTLKNPILDRRSEQQGNGTGLQAVKKRLELIYPDKHDLNISISEEYRVSLKLETT